MSYVYRNVKGGRAMKKDPKYMGKYFAIFGNLAERML